MGRHLVGGTKEEFCWWTEEHSEIDKEMPFHSPSLDG
jgi:hypothetical protein